MSDGMFGRMSEELLVGPGGVVDVTELELPGG